MRQGLSRFGKNPKLLVRQVITRNVGAIVHLVTDCYGLKELRVALNGAGH